MALFDELGKILVEAIKDQMAAEGWNASGTAINSVYYKVTPSGVEIWGEDYIAFINRGRPAGKRPPISKILQWVLTKGLTAKTASGKAMKPRSLAFLIARAIGREGMPTKGSPHRGKLNVIDRAVENANEKIDKEINEFANILINEHITKHFV